MSKFRLAFGICMIVGLGGIGVIVLSAKSQVHNTGLTVEFVQAALRHQAGAPVEVKFTRRVKTLGSNGNGSEYTVLTHYIRTSDVLRIEERKPATSGTIVTSFDRNTNEGRSLYGTLPGNVRGRIGNRMLDPLGVQDFVECSLFPVYGGELVDFVIRGTISTQMEKVNGHDCWRIELPLLKGSSPPDAVAQVVWLDPDIGFCPRRFTVEWKHKQPTVVDFLDYQQISDGIWFHKRQTVVAHNPSGKGKTVQSIVIDEMASPTSPPRREDVLVRFPSGAIVYRENIHKEYTVP